MNDIAPPNSAIVGCGPSGCFLLNLLRQSQTKAKLIAVDEDQGSLDMSGADLKILVKPGEKLVSDIGAFKVVFLVFDPSEGSAIESAKGASALASVQGSYVYAIAVNKPGNDLSEMDLSRSFGGVAIIDAAWVMKKRGDNEEEHALQIAFNFAAHTLAFLVQAIDSGELDISAFKDATAGGVCSFAASHISDAEAIYALTLSPIQKSSVMSGIVFIEAGADDVLARRIFLGVLRGLPGGARVDMLRVTGLEPFKVLAMLVH
jgi:hypothetical protein